MNVRCEHIKYKKDRFALKIAAKYVADVINEDVVMGKREEALKEFLEDLADLIKVEISVPQIK